MSEGQFSFPDDSNQINATHHSRIDRDIRATQEHNFE